MKKYNYKNKNVTITQLKNFNFRFVNHVTRDLYEIIDARKWSKEVNAKKPHFIDNTRMAFWCDECMDYSYVLYLKDILPFE